MKNDKINRVLIAKALALGMILSLASCSDTEQEVERRQTNIGFTINVDENGWSGNEAFATRNNEDEADIRSFSGIESSQQVADTVLPLTAEGGGSAGLPPMFLHVRESDFSDAVSSEQDAEEQTPHRTRATPVRKMYPTLGLFAALHPAGTNWGTHATSYIKPAYLYNKKVTQLSGWETNKPWPGRAHRLTFFAYAPHNCPGVKFLSSPQNGSPILQYTTPDYVKNQTDLLTAFEPDVTGDTNGAFPLNFKHALTAVKFVCGNNMQAGKVVRVSLENVYNRGLYDMGMEGWRNAFSKRTFTQNLNKTTTGTPNEALTTPTKTFMMLPQTLPSEAKVKVVFEDNQGTQHNLEAYITGSEWTQGKTVVYEISTSSINWHYTLNVTAPDEFPFSGGTKNYTVESYKENGGGSKIAVPWTTEYSENGGSWTTTKPDWLTGFTANAPGSTTPETYSATVAHQTGASDSPHTAALRAATPKGSSGSLYNLSNQTNGEYINIENTANCYVVDAPGYYSFPLVYGNSIKRGARNRSAYTSMASGNNILGPFINHEGAGISGPYLLDNGCSPTRAELIWQDAPNLVTEIDYEGRLFGGKGGIKFKVPEAFICQGNALIAIKDADNNVLWSWHIWVTDEKINETIAITNHQDYVYRMMPVNLGWCDGEEVTYAQRSCKVKFKTEDQSQVITITQNPGQTTTFGNNTYYAWGRKDPFRPGSGKPDNSNKTWYNASGTASTASHAVEKFKGRKTDLMNYILKPDVADYFDGDHKCANLWSADNDVYTANDNPVVKTIYDPSPVGFKLPPSNVFTGFTHTGVTSGGYADINGEWNNNYKNKGMMFYTEAYYSEPTIFFPAAGSWNTYNLNNYKKAFLKNVGRNGNFWTAAPKDRLSGYYMLFSDSHVVPLGNCGMNSILSVRPCRE